MILKVIVDIEAFYKQSTLGCFYMCIYVNFGISIQRRTVEIFLLTFRQRVVRRDAK